MEEIDPKYVIKYLMIKGFVKNSQIKFETTHPYDGSILNIETKLKSNPMCIFIDSFKPIGKRIIRNISADLDHNVFISTPLWDNDDGQIRNEIKLIKHYNPDKNKIVFEYLDDMIDYVTYNQFIIGKIIRLDEKMIWHLTTYNKPYLFIDEIDNHKNKTDFFDFDKVPNLIDYYSTKLELFNFDEEFSKLEN
jgi:hypothetical protein